MPGLGRPNSLSYADIPPVLFSTSKFWLELFCKVFGAVVCTSNVLGRELDFFVCFELVWFFSCLLCSAAVELSNILTVSRSTNSKYFCSVSESSLGLEFGLVSKLLLTLVVPGLNLSSVCLSFCLSSVSDLSFSSVCLMEVQTASSAAMLVWMLVLSSPWVTPASAWGQGAGLPFSLASTCSVRRLAFFCSSLALCCTSRSSVSIADKYNIK